MKKKLSIGVSLLAASVNFVSVAFSQEIRVTLTPGMVVNERERGNPEAMVDEQDDSRRSAIGPTREHLGGQLAVLEDVSLQLPTWTWGRNEISPACGFSTRSTTARWSSLPAHRATGAKSGVTRR